MTRTHLPVALFALVWLAACAARVADGASPDGPDEAGLGAGKADGSSYGNCELSEVVLWLNDPLTSLDVLKNAGVHTRAAKNLVAYRNGADGTAGTADDARFATIAEVDDVRYVGKVAIRQLVSAVTARCVDPAASNLEAVFSPQPYPQSHLVRTAALIDTATASLDIAMYSFRDSGIRQALDRATSRGVSIRMVFQSANADRRDPEGTLSAALETMGIEVRYVNVIMHHKFVIVDGPREFVAQAETARLASGSGNWSNRAGTVYNENTVFVRDNAEIVLRYQREFNHVWANSRPVIWNEDLPHVTSIPITDEDIAAYDEVGTHVLFTSDNFRTYVSSSNGPTFSLHRDIAERASTITSRIAAMIEEATDSILIASGHMRSRPIAEALMAKRLSDPDIEIRVYLDGQEYASAGSTASDIADRDACASDSAAAAAAGRPWSARKKWECPLKAVRYGYLLDDAGIDLRYKYYAYFWHYSFAQMHHKYLIIDGKLITGSFNLSFNAEYATLENTMIFDEAAHPALVQSYRNNFEALWSMGEADDLLGTLLADVDSGTSFPIVFAPMSLHWTGIRDLKSSIASVCTNLDEAYADPRANRTCHP